MKNISFPVPKGFTPPEGVAEGDAFDFMASGYFKGTKMYLTSVEGVEIFPGKKVEVEVEEEETSSPEMGMVEAVEQGMA
jgi:hypothetical protein